MRKVTFFIAICAVLATSYSRTCAGEKIRLTTQEWEPYQTYRNNSLEGVAVQVVTCAMDKSGRPYEIGVYPWKRAQYMVEEGRAHGFFSASQNEARDRYATMSTTIASQEWTWYLLKENPLNPSDEMSFKENADVAAMFGSNMLTWLTSNGYRVAGNPKDTEALTTALLLKRYDAILANNLVMTDVLKKMNLSPERFRRYPNKNKPLGVYWSKTFLSENAKFLERFNRFVKECTQF